MAETDAATHATGKGFEALKQKVGPLPLGAWLLAGLGIWYYMQRKNTKGTAGQQTDPAGNVGPIDPATGYVYGSPQDQAGLAGQNASGTSGSGGSTVGGSYPDNASWGRAAINYLVGIGIDPTTANEAIQSFLASQPLTANQQADVNLAIQALGAPPQPPGPVGNIPNPVVGGTGGSGTNATGTGSTGTSGSGGGGDLGGSGGGTPSTGTGTPPPTSGGTPTGKPTATNPVTGLAVVSRHRTSMSVKWNAARNATSYHVKCTEAGSNAVKGEFNTSSTTAQFGGLTGGRMYVVDVWAEPESGRVGTGPHAHVSATLPTTG